MRNRDILIPAAIAVGVGLVLLSRSSGPDGGGSGPPPGVSEPILYRIEEGQKALAKREKNTGKNISRGARGMGQVDGLVLHQMGFSRGNDPSKYYGVTAHFIILPNGQIVQLHGENEGLNASHGFNSYTVAVEFAGNFPNTKGNWYKPEKFGQNYLTEEQISAGRYLIDYLRKRLPQMGSPGLRHVFAHRQSDDQRQNCPGPDVWYQVGQWALDNRGLTDTVTGAPNFTVGDGTPIPAAWRQRSQNPVGVA